MAPSSISWCTACSRHRSTASPGQQCAHSRCLTCSTRSRVSSRNRPTWTTTGYQYPGPRCRTLDRANVPTTPGRCLTSRLTSSRAIPWWTRPSGRSTNSQSLSALVSSKCNRLLPTHPTVFVFSNIYNTFIVTLSNCYLWFYFLSLFLCVRLRSRSYRFTVIAVDPQVKAIDGKTYDVLFIGTGKIKDLIMVLHPNCILPLESYMGESELWCM